MKVVAVVGTYRKAHTIETAVDEVLRGARDAGAEIETIRLLDKHIEFCTNCRNCTLTPGPERGRCVLKDDMEAILNTLEQADAYIFACPVNFFTVTALMKRFIERLVCYGYWPWGKIPKNRLTGGHKKAVLITSSACPAWIGRVAFRSTAQILKAAAKCLGAGSFRKLYFGSVAQCPDQTLPDAAKRCAYRAGRRLIE